MPESSEYKETKSTVESVKNPILEDSVWKTTFAKNMRSLDILFNQMPTLNVIRATALVGAMKATQKKSEESPDKLNDALKSEWTILAGENKAYVYGEVSLLALSQTLHRHGNVGGRPGVFYDLGSGSGRAVFSAAANHPNLTKLIGIEQLEGLHSVAERSLEVFQNDPEWKSTNDRQTISFKCADFLQYDWSDGDVMLAVSTCFPVPLMRQIEERAIRILKPGTIFITLTKPLVHEAWEKLESFKRLHGWGPSWMHVYRLKYQVPGNEY